MIIFQNFKIFHQVISKFSLSYLSCLLLGLIITNLQFPFYSILKLLGFEMKLLIESKTNKINVF